MKGLAGVHLLEPTLKSLERQDFEDFELVLVDALWESRNLLEEAHSLGRWSFPIKITHPDPWWGNAPGWSKQSSGNQGIRASTGEWILQLDDCCEIPDRMLGRAIEATQYGSPHLLFCYKNGGRLTAQPEDGKREFARADLPELPPSLYSTVEEAKVSGVWDDKHFVRDSRWELAESSGGRYNLPWSCCYAYGFFKRSKLYRVNGYDERFDGCKPLGDVELGSRLEMAGAWDGFVDTSLFVYENQHGPCETWRMPKSVWSNFDLIYWMRQNGMWYANDKRISETEMKRICNGEITGQYKPIAPYVFNQSQPEEWERQRLWIERQRIFTL